MLNLMSDFSIVYLVAKESEASPSSECVLFGSFPDYLENRTYRLTKRRYKT